MYITRLMVHCKIPEHVLGMDSTHWIMRKILKYGFAAFSVHMKMCYSFTCQYLYPNPSGKE